MLHKRHLGETQRLKKLQKTGVNSAGMEREEEEEWERCQLLSSALSRSQTF